MTTPAESTSSASDNTPATVFVHRNLTIKPFLKQSNSHDTALKWSKWKKDIERQFRFFGIQDPVAKKDGLLIYGGEELVDIDDAIPDPTSQAGDDVYTILIRKIDNHYMPKKNKDFARFQLSELHQNTGEQLSDYYARVREIAKKCDYGDHESDAIRDHLIRTMLNNRIRMKAIRENWLLDRILTEAALDEQTAVQAKAIEKKIDADRPERVKKIGATRSQNQTPCGRCGNCAKHDTCPAMGATCGHCGKPDHFAKMCFTKNPRAEGRRQYHNQQKPRGRNGNRNGPRRQQTGKRDTRDWHDPKHATRNVRHVNQRDDTSSSDDECFLHHLKIHHTSTQHSGPNTCRIRINGIEVEAEPDSGSDTNVMDEFQYKLLQDQAPEMQMRSSKVKLKTLKEELPVIGEVDVKIGNKTREISTTLVIIAGTIDSPPLLGRPTLEELGMILIDETGGLRAEEQVRSIKTETSGHAELENILDKFKGRFTGIGKAMRDGKEIQISLPMKENATPIAQKPRRVPYLLTEPLKKRIEEFEENDIIEKVPEHEAITWCSPLVVQPKPKNPKDIRACLDLRLLNKSMLRTRQVQAPITEDFIREFKGCKIFSKIDLNHGYHQFSLDKESRRAMTFSTPWGNYRYKRLAFGGINSQDLFDAEIAKVISGIPKVLNNRDDIMIGGTDWEEHNRNLHALMKRMEESNLTMRKEKCKFGQPTLNFHGHLFTADGLKPSPDKTNAVQQCQPPRTREELVSFLQMMAYLSRYIRNFSSRCEPLRRLTRDKTKFEWTEAQQTAFEDLKLAITSAPVLIPYYPERDTLVICDGSPMGLGGGLFQKTQNGYQPVHYVSRTLTETESRYSQIEREALAAEFTTSRLQMYLLGGKHFQLATDHKPLLPLFNNPQAKLPPRIERLIMKMQNLDFTMIHIPGKENMTDYMSRHPLPETAATGIEQHVKAVTRIEHAVILDKIREETKDDAELQQLKKAMQSGIWNKNDPTLKPYIDLQAELYETDDVILRLNKIIPPASLRDKIVRIAHKQGHLGLSKTKEMIRHKYWWPGMNTRIEDSVKRCFECQIATNTHHTEPAKMTELPQRPWTTIEADFCGPFPTGEYALVMTDQYSRYPEVEFSRSTSCEAVRGKFKKVFSTHGVPETLQTDNGPPFNSQAFTELAQETGFKHRRITPIHPKAQGQVEGFNKLINKILSIANQDSLDPHEAVYDMLQAYRSTPHPATNEPPYELLMNREVRTNLDHFPTATSSKDEEVRKRDRAYKERCKGYHDKRHNTREHTLKAGDAVVVKREHKRKGQTPYEPYVYIVTQTKGSKIVAKRIKDERAICRDASRFKLLRTVRIQERGNQNVTQTADRVTVPPAAPVDVQNTATNPNAGAPEQQQQATATATAEEQPISDTEEQPPHNINNMQEPPDQEPPTLRRSERQTKSTYEGRLRDYTK